MSADRNQSVPEKLKIFHLTVHRLGGDDPFVNESVLIAENEEQVKAMANFPIPEGAEAIITVIGHALPEELPRIVVIGPMTEIPKRKGEEVNPSKMSKEEFNAYAKKLQREVEEMPYEQLEVELLKMGIEPGKVPRETFAKMKAKLEREGYTVLESEDEEEIRFEAFKPGRTLMPLIFKKKKR